LTNIIDKLKGKKKATVSASAETPTIPVTEEMPVETAPITRRDIIHLDITHPSVGCAQSVGIQRDHNEDALLAMNTLLAGNGEYIPFGLFIVADGMGGHNQGEVASGLAVRTIASHVMRKAFLNLLNPKPDRPNESLQEILEAGLQEAHRQVMKEAPGSGTTLTAVLLLDRQMSIAHVGDSRLYAITPDGEMRLLTRDHSLVMRMMEMGQLSEEDAAIHPQRNVLYRALGQGEAFSPDISTSPLPGSGTLLLCSDGLWGVVPQAELSRIVKSYNDPQIAAQLLIDAANAAGGPDNISAILIRLPE
jgi:PPM family protein phosphatase